MKFNSGKEIAIKIFFGITIFTALLTGIFLGLAFAVDPDIEIRAKIEAEEKMSEPTKIFDRNGNLITELFQNEKREIIDIDDLPRHVIYALLTREDQDFFEHPGFSVTGIVRAVIGQLTGNEAGGGSTISQQLAGHIFLDRNDRSIWRKIWELWYSIQMERVLTKYEILELYMNKMPFGGGTNGIEAASQHFFGHAAKDLTVAESALLMLQLSSQQLYNPYKQPESAKERTKYVLQQMVDLGYTTQVEADETFVKFWEKDYNYTRVASKGAFLNRKDAAPYFTSYIVRLMDNEYFVGPEQGGPLNIYQDGLKIHTTLNLDYQAAADKHMNAQLDYWNSIYRRSSKAKASVGQNTFVPIVELLGLSFNQSNFIVAQGVHKSKARNRFINEISPALEMTALLFGQTDVKNLSSGINTELHKKSFDNMVQGALIALDNESGHILAMVGGTGFETLNQNNRAIDLYRSPGSTFKPLYYAAGIESREFNAASFFYDRPKSFDNDDGTQYTPLNYGGRWRGPILLRKSLALSLNIPSIEIMDSLGFDASIEMCGDLLGIEREKRANYFPRKFPLALGAGVTASPLQMARSYAIFANDGKEVEPIAIRRVEDRNGRVIFSPEQELRQAQQAKGSDIQVMSPQAAYIMSDLLQETVRTGTLYHISKREITSDIPMAGKTGTSENWSDAWTIGFSPYMTAAVWFGFDSGGNTLGSSGSGAGVAGPVWARFMNDAHKSLPDKDFDKPSGIVTVGVTASHGMLPPPDYNGRVIYEHFIKGTEPNVNEIDNYNDYLNEHRVTAVKKYADLIITDFAGSTDIKIDTSGLTHLETESGSSGNWDPWKDDNRPSKPGDKKDNENDSGNSDDDDATIEEDTEYDVFDDIFGEM